MAPPARPSVCEGKARPCADTHFGTGGITQSSHRSWGGMVSPSEDHHFQTLLAELSSHLHTRGCLSSWTQWDWGRSSQACTLPGPLLLLQLKAMLSKPISNSRPCSLSLCTISYGQEAGRWLCFRTGHIQACTLFLLLSWVLVCCFASFCFQKKWLLLQQYKNFLQNCLAFESSD